MAVRARLAVALTGVTLLLACGGYAPVIGRGGPLYVYVSVDGSNSKQVTGEQWRATVCADDTCKTFSPHTCEANAGRDCYIGGGLTVIFKYPKLEDRPHTLSVRIVSFAGKLLYTDSKSNDCRLVQNICTAKFLLP